MEQSKHWIEQRRPTRLADERAGQVGTVGCLGRRAGMRGPHRVKGGVRQCRHQAVHAGGHICEQELQRVEVVAQDRLQCRDLVDCCLQEQDGGAVSSTKGAELETAGPTAHPIKLQCCLSALSAMPPGTSS